MFVPRSALHIFRVNWGHRGVVLNLIKRDFQIRYRGAVIGSYWHLLHPLAMITIYTVIFSQIMRSRLGINTDNPFAYTLYLCAGLIPWSAFMEMASRGTRVFIDYANLIKKVSFPIEILVPIIAGTATVNFFITFSLYTLLLIVTGWGVDWPFLLLPVIYALQILFSLGFCMFVSVINVFFRDLEQMTQIVLQVWFWATPIVYLQEYVPSSFKLIIQFNPYYYFVRAYQDICVYKAWPDLNGLLLSG